MGLPATGRRARGKRLVFAFHSHHHHPHNHLIYIISKSQR
nr:MAG TPA: Drug exporters of the RND protein, transporter, RND family [Caudoviricetes sp.]